MSIAERWEARTFCSRANLIQALLYPTQYTSISGGDGSKPQALLYPTQYTSISGGDGSKPQALLYPTQCTMSIWGGDGSKPQALLYPTQYLYQEMVQNLKLCCILHNIYIRRWFKTSSFAVSYTISILGDGSKPQALLYPTQYTSLKGELVQNLKLYYIFRS